MSDDVQPQAPSTPRKLHGIRRFLDVAYRTVFGFDYFISYTWRDKDDPDQRYVAECARQYAVQLRDALKKQGLVCFLDSDDYAKGQNWRISGQLALRGTSRLILILSPAVTESQAVLDEVEYFKKNTGKAMVPLEFIGCPPQGDTARLLSLVETEALRIREPATALRDGPSTHAVGELVKTFNLTRQNVFRQRLMRSTIGVLLVLLIGAGVLGLLAELQRRKAAKSANDAIRSLALQSIEVGAQHVQLGEMDPALWRFQMASQLADQVSLEFSPKRHLSAWKGYVGTPLAIEFDAVKLLPNNPYYSMGANQYERFDPAPLAISSDGERIVTASGDVAQEWNLASRKAVGTPFHSSGFVHAFAFDADTSQVLCLSEGAVPGEEQKLGIEKNSPWHTFICRCHLRLSGFSPDRKMAITVPEWSDPQADQDRTVCMWELPTGRHLANLPVERVTSFAFSPNSTRVATLTDSGDVAIWNCRSGQLESTVVSLDPQKPSSTAAASVPTPIEAPETLLQYELLNISATSLLWPMEETLVLGLRDSSRVAIWEATQNQFVAVMSPETDSTSPRSVTLLAFRKSPKETVLVSAAKKNVSVWNLETREEKLQLEHAANVTAIAVSPDGQLLACGTETQELWLWDLSHAMEEQWDVRKERFAIIESLPVRNHPYRTRYLNKSPKIDTLQFSPRSDELVVVCGDTPRVFSMAPFAPQTSFSGSLSPAAIGRTVFSQDGKRVLLSDAEGRISLWEIGSASQLKTWQYSRPLGAWPVAFDPESTHFAIYGAPANKSSCAVDIYEISTLKKLRRAVEPKESSLWQLAVAFCNDGGGLVACTDSALLSWPKRHAAGRSPTKTDLKTSMYNDPIGVASTDGKWLVISKKGEAYGKDNEVALWDIEDGKPLFAIRCDNPVTALALSGDAHRLAFAMVGGVVQVWKISAQGGEMTMTIDFHDDVNTLALSDSGELLHVAGHVWQLWHIPSSKPLSMRHHFLWQVRSAAFAPDDKHILLGCEDGVARLWAVPEPTIGIMSEIERDLAIRTMLRRQSDGRVERLSAKTWSDLLEGAKDVEQSRD